MTMEAGSIKGTLSLAYSEYMAVIERAKQASRDLAASNRKTKEESKRLEKETADLAKRLTKEVVTAQKQAYRDTERAAKQAQAQQSAAIKQHIKDLNNMVQYEKQVAANRAKAFWGGGQSNAMKAAVADTSRLKSELLFMSANAAQASSTFYKLGNAIQVYGSFAGRGLAERIAQFYALRSATVAAARAQDLLTAKATNRPIIPGQIGPAQSAAIGAVTAKYASIIKVAGLATVATVGFGAAVYGVVKATSPFVKAAMDLEDSFAGVIKTVNGTKEELAALRNELLEMSTKIPLSVHELNRIAESAGQLGVARKDIQKFTETMAMMGVATNLTAEEAATAFASWKNITRTPMDEVDRLASTVSALGNTTNSTEKQIVEFGVRLAGAGKVIGLTDANIAAISATLASVGLEAEAGGTAFSKLFYKVYDAAMSSGESLKLFSVVAGMTSKEFKAIMKTDPARVVKEFITGIGQYIEAGGNFVEISNAMGMKEVRLRDALARSASAYKDLGKNLSAANLEYRRNQQLFDEAQKRFETTRNQTVLLSNAWTKFKVSLGGTEVYRALILNLTDIISKLDELAEKINDADAERKKIQSGKKPEPFNLFGLWPYFDEPIYKQASERKTDLAKLRSEMGRSESLITKGYQNIESAAMSMYEKLTNSQISQSFLKKILPPLDAQVAQWKAAGGKVETIFAGITTALQLHSSSWTGIVTAFWDNFVSESSRRSREIKKATQEALNIENFMKSLEKSSKFLDKLIETLDQDEQKLVDKGEELIKKLFPADRIMADLNEAIESLTAADYFDTETFEKYGKYLIEQYEKFPDAIETAIVALQDFQNQFAMDETKYYIIGTLINTLSKGYVDLANSIAFADDKLAAQTMPSIDPKDLPAWKQYWNEFANQAPKVDEITQKIQTLKEAGKLDEDEEISLLAPGIYAEMGRVSDKVFKRILDKIGDAKDALVQFLKEQRKIDKEGLFKQDLLNTINMVGSAISSVGGKFAKFGQAVQTGVRIATIALTSMNPVLKGVQIAVEALTMAFGLFGDKGEEELHGMAKVIDEIKEASEQWIDELTDKFLDFVKTGKFALDEFLQYVVDEVARIATRELVITPIVSAIGNFIGMAKGGVIDNGNVMPFSKGGVVNRPQLFPMAKGAGLMGEAGPEAIMPLKRLSGGKLGVQSVGGDVFVNVNDYRSGGSPVEVQERMTPNGRMIDVFIRDAVNSVITGGGADRALGMRYGLAARGY